MIAFLLTPLARYIVLGVVIAALVGGLVLVTNQNKQLKLQNAELVRANQELQMVLEAEREAKGRADDARKMTPEELLDYWNKKQDDKELKDNGPDVLKKKPIPCRLLVNSYCIG